MRRTEGLQTLRWRKWDSNRRSPDYFENLLTGARLFARRPLATRKRKLAKPASAEPQLRADPVGMASDRRVSFRSRAGQELEDVLHLRHDFERHVDARFARKLRQLTAARGVLAKVVDHRNGMACGQRHKLITLPVEKRIGAEEKAADAQLGEGCEG